MVYKNDNFRFAYMMTGAFSAAFGHKHEKILYAILPVLLGAIIFTLIYQLVKNKSSVVKTVVLLLLFLTCLVIASLMN